MSGTNGLSASGVLARVAEKTVVAEGLVTLTLTDPDGARLPDRTPGSHIDLALPGGTTRQYSLCGDRWDACSYRVGVLREPAGRGGSAYVHDELADGALVGIGVPRNNFRLVTSEEYLFIAGGVGIPPLLPMIVQAEMLGADFTVLYGGRSRDSMAFLDRYDVYAMGRYGQVRAALVDWQGFQSGAVVGLVHYRQDPGPPHGPLETDTPRRSSSGAGGNPERPLAAAVVDPVVRRRRAVGRRGTGAAGVRCGDGAERGVSAVRLPRRGRHPRGRPGERAAPGRSPVQLVRAAERPRRQRAGHAGKRAARIRAQCAREALTGDGFGAQVWAAADRGDIATARAPQGMRAMLSAGVDTTVHGLGAVLYAFATHSEQWQALWRAPRLARMAFDEAVRWQSPGQTFFRTATSDIQIGDTRIAEGMKT